MQVNCSQCAQPITLTDIIESNNGGLSHVECKRASEVQRWVQAVREAVQRLAKESQQLRDTSDVLNPRG